MRILGATRLSRDTDTSTSIERQREAIEAWIKAHGHTKVEITEDVDVSGAVSPFTRPDLGPWLNGKSGQWDAICIAKLDRLSRSLLDFADFVKWCRDRGKAVICLDPNLNFSTPDGRMFANILMSFAEWEREMIGMRVADSRRKTRQQARWTGGNLPYGYQVAPSGDGYVLVPQPQEQAIVRELAGRVIAGTSVNAVTRWLNDEKVPSRAGKVWSPTTVLRMLHNPVLRGYVMHGSEVVRDSGGMPVTREPLIDDDTWSQLQAALEANSSPGSGVRSNANTLLQIAFCLDCRQPMYARSRKDRPYDYYECKTRRTGGKCKGRAVRQSDLENAISETLMYTLGKKIIPKVTVIPAVSHTAELEKVREQIRALENEFEADHLSADAFASMMTKLEAKRDALAALPQREEQTIYEPSGKTVAEVWQAMDWEARGQFMRQWGIRALCQGAGFVALFSPIFQDPELGRAFGFMRKDFALTD